MPNLSPNNPISNTGNTLPTESGSEANAEAAVKVNAPAHQLRQHSAGLVDALILLVTSNLIVQFIVLPLIVEPTFYINGSWFLLLLVIFRFVCFLLFNRTIGMYVSRITLLNKDLKKLSIPEKFFASFFILINGINYYRLQKGNINNFNSISHRHLTTPD